MLIPFFYQLREGGMKTSITELLMLHEVMNKGLAGQSVDDFYFLSRACLVKDESQLDRFDRIFAAYFKGVEDSLADLIWIVAGARSGISAERDRPADHFLQQLSIGCVLEDPDIIVIIHKLTLLDSVAAHRRGRKSIGRIEERHYRLIVRNHPDD